MAITASDIKRLKKIDIFIEGSKLEGVTDRTPDVAVTEDIVPVYGQDSAVKDRTLDNGTLSLTMLEEDKTANIINDLSTLQNPDSTDPRGYDMENFNEIFVWEGFKTKDNAWYEKSIWYGACLFNPGFPQGPAGDRAARTYDGTTEVPREFVNLAICSEKVAGASGSEVALSQTPVEDPVNSGKYAIGLAVLASGSGVTFKKQIVSPIKAAHVKSDGNVVIGEVEADADQFTAAEATHVYVCFLRNSGNGIYPDLTPVEKIHTA